MGRKRVAKDKKQKRVTTKLIQHDEGGKVKEAYRIMEEFIKTDRPDLKDLHIGLAWRFGWRPDPYHNLRLGQCKKRGDLDRELDMYDFIILLNGEAFPNLKDEEKRRLVLHELMHAQIETDDQGHPKLNDRGRVVCRIRRHDIEDFREVVRKFGWKEDLSKIAQERLEDAKEPLFQQANGPKPAKVPAKRGRKKAKTA
jgi:hypothetical protein